MRRLIFFVSLALVFIACNNKPAGKKETNKIDSPSTAKDTTVPPRPGSDRDEHGCIPSAGYTWSVVKNNCIRIFEEGIRLNSFAGEERSAFVIFNDNNTLAELYIPGQTGSVLLESEGSNSHRWKKGDWQLEKKTKLVLERSGTLEFLE